MTLVFEFKYAPEVHKGLIFSSADRKTLYIRSSVSEKFVTYTKTCCEDCPPLILVEDEGTALEYDLRELPILVTDATQLPASVKRTDTTICANNHERRFNRLDDMLYLQLQGVHYYVRIEDIPLKSV